MRLHPLIDYEAELLQVPSHEWRRATQPAPVSQSRPAPEAEFASAD